MSEVRIGLGVSQVLVFVAFMIFVVDGSKHDRTVAKPETQSFCSGSIRFHSIIACMAKSAFQEELDRRWKTGPDTITNLVDWLLLGCARQGASAERTGSG